ncbi:hypothetical protein FGO68_gene3244 [Halteria grandinella]|uniref:Uncharacterized protein n=1 Tax=Halteria grandinella TaxID=5974 RepID=A0A8J8P3F6_HALGN|nr:hypothetical protein FGO68_gene3244 [Halteria grandinella]
MFALTSQQIEKAKTYRKHQEEQQREKSFLHMNRWVFYRQKEEEKRLLREKEKKYYIKIKFKVFFQRLTMVQTKLKNYIYGMRQRMDFLRKYWEKEHHNMIMQLAKVKNKNKKEKDFLARVRAIPDSVREAVLYAYMEKCKHQNAIDFFNWHRQLYGGNTGPGGMPRDKNQSIIISLRLGRRRKIENNLQSTSEDGNQILKNLYHDEQHQVTNNRTASQGATNNSAAANKRKTIKESTFLTGVPGQVAQPASSVEDLINQTPFSFQFVPTKGVMRKMIMRASQLKNSKELDLTGMNQ